MPKADGPLSAKFGHYTCLNAMSKKGQKGYSSSAEIMNTVEKLGLEPLPRA
jgi:hypothetical protein